MNIHDYTPEPEVGQPLPEGMVHVSAPLENVMAQIVQAMRDRHGNAE